MTDQHSRIRQAIRSALQSGPKNTPELVRATGFDGQMMGNHLKALLREGAISRVETTKGRYRYYIGLTAPNYTGYVPAVRNIDAPRLTSRVSYSMPIRRVNVGAGNGRVNRITLSAEPFSIPAFVAPLYSPTQGQCDPAQPGNPTGEDADVTTHTVVAVPLTGPGALNPLPANGGM